MQGFTYEHTDKKQQLETYEWDRFWIDHANDNTTRRVLYIGDSISGGTANIATERSGGEIFFDNFATSKAIDNPYLLEAIEYFAKQEGSRNVVLFNNGLHGWHLDEETDYLNYYDYTVGKLVNLFPESELVILLTTHVKDEVRDGRVKKRNEAALAVAKKYSLRVVDLYSVTLENKDMLAPDGVHFQRGGYEIIADTLIEAVKK